MFLKKIVEWISENPHLGVIEESFSKTTMEQSEEFLNRNTESTNNDDNWSSISTGGTTSRLEGSLDDRNEVVDKENNKGESADGDSGFKLITTTNKTDSNTQIEVKKANSDCDLPILERLPPIRSSTANFNPVDGVVMKKGTGYTAKQFSASSIGPHMSSRKIVSGFDRNTKKDSRPSKSIFTQSEVRADKQCDNTIGEKNNADCTAEVMEHEGKSKSLPISQLSLSNYIEKHRKPESSESLYGMLYVVGCNKVVPDYLAKKMNAKYILRKRSTANGLVEDVSCVTSDVETTLSASPEKHFILYPLDDDHTVVAAFKHDTLSDIFQIGRCEKSPIDFTVDDINPSDKSRHGVSRFACRISVRRDQNHKASIYAGAFDSSRKIVVGESSLAHDYCGKTDGFTTNGVLILKPEEEILGKWREVSISGHVYPLRSSQIDLSKRPRILEESNVLIDGTLIDLCGVTLIWRTPEGLKKTPSEYYLNRFLSTLYKCVPECSLLSRDSNMLVSQGQRTVKKAYIYLSCGHIVGLTLLKPPDNHSKGWSCPTCRAIGPIKEFTLGTETGFCFDDELPSYAFKPCGHVASQKTVQFWSSVVIPNHRNDQYSLCPFCGKKLNFIARYVKLNLPF